MSSRGCEGGSWTSSTARSLLSASGRLARRGAQRYGGETGWPLLAAPEWGGLCFLRVRKPGHRAAPLVPSSRRSAAVQLAVAPEWGLLSIGITVTALFRAAARARFRPCRG